MTTHRLWSGLLMFGAVCVIGLLGPATAAAAEDAAALELEKSDRIAIIGNALAERMQHHGWTETLIQDRFAEHELVIRNLGFEADALTVRQRSAGFGSPDDWLSRVEADVVLAMFGFAESFAGEEGLDDFRADLERFVDDTREQQYNGESGPRLVLVSPIAHEDLDSPHLPSGERNNANLHLYTQVMADVAEAKGVGFVDLFTPTQDGYEAAAEPWTINGIHLNDRGQRELAKLLEAGLFGGETRDDLEGLAELREAVLDKNWHWFQRYRKTDGYSVYGGRSHLEFVDDQTNREVMMRELEVLDVMTANRDERIWAVAQGGDLEVDDSNTPDFLPVKTNLPGDEPDGSHKFLGGEEAIEQMELGPDLEINLFASEEQFPELANPVQMAFDTEGRLWVAVWPTYPHWQPKSSKSDKLLVFEDTDGDGRADERTVFAEDLRNPTGFAFHDGGVIVANAPYLLFLKDTNGDGKADHRERILGGLDSADTHHTANSFTYGPGGGLHFGEGVFHRTQIETPYGIHRNRDAAIWRFEPRTWKVQRAVPYGFANPHGHVFDRWGQNVIHDGTGSQPYLGSAISVYLPEPAKHPSAPQVYQQRTRPTSGTAYLSSAHFPEEYEGDLVVANVIGFAGILRYDLSEDGAGIAGEEQDFLVRSSDPNFRPSDAKVGPDGAVYFTDWHNPIIGHMQHNLRDPSRDKTHGRIYRITHAEGEDVEQPAIEGEPIEDLVALLDSPVKDVRERAKIELTDRETDDVLAAVDEWAAQWDADDPADAHRLMEALWVYQWQDVVNEALLRRMLDSPEPLARAAATRVLCHWRDAVSEPLALLAELAEDEHPRVRLEAVRATSFIRTPAAVDVALLATRHPQGRYLEYVIDATMRSLESVWKAALMDGVALAEGNDAGIAYLLERVSAEELLRLPKNERVQRAILTRDGVDRADRRQAVRDLAELSGESEVAVIVKTLRELDEAGRSMSGEALDALGQVLLARRPSELSDELKRIQALAEAADGVYRQWAYAAWVAADGGFDGVWAHASESVDRLRDAVLAVERIGNRRLRAKAYDRVRPLLDGLPPELAEQVSDEPGTAGRYVRIELPRQGTLTLAEVEVVSGGENIAPAGEASQSSTSHGGAASRAIDGNRSGAYGDDGQTHTQENSDQPWWELDLGTERSIEAVAVWNRSENNGAYADRLEGFTLTILDAQRRPVYERTGLPAPEREAVYETPHSPADAVRRAAVRAVVATGEREGETFAALAALFADEPNLRATVVDAIEALPEEARSAEPAEKVVRTMVEHLEQMPASQRTSEAMLAMQRLGYELAEVLPEDQAAGLRDELSRLGVTRIVIRPIDHQMLFDEISFAVEAGSEVELVFENTDAMPHNLLITEPGEMERVARAAEAMAAEPDAFERGFVPEIDQVLWATDLLMQGQEQTLTFTAPERADEYPYVCTFPGHWQRMYGVMIVVENLEQWQENPTTPTDPLHGGELERQPMLEDPAEAIDTPTVPEQ